MEYYRVANWTTVQFSSPLLWEKLGFLFYKPDVTHMASTSFGYYNFLNVFEYPLWTAIFVVGSILTAALFFAPMANSKNNTARGRKFKARPRGFSVSVNILLMCRGQAPAPAPETEYSTGHS